MKKIILISVFIFCQFCVHAQNWQILQGSPNRYVTRLYEDTVSNKLIVAGGYSQINGENIRGIATWNGVQWDSLDAGMDEYNSVSFPSNTLAVTRYYNDIIAGGSFSQAGSVYASFLAKWDGFQWDSIFGGQPNNTVSDIITYNNDLYICGVFDSIGNTSANCVAKWNGSTWASIGNNYNFADQSGSINKIRFYEGNLYVAGMFRDPSGNLCRIAKWDGNVWQFFSNDLSGGFCVIEDLEVFNNELYVSGLFYMADGNAGTSIVRWNDTTWRDVGGSVEVGVINSYPSIKDLSVYNGKLYCVGNFESIGGVSAKGLACWDGTDWCSFNSNFELNAGQYIGAGCIAFYHDTMYVGGGFRIVDGDSIQYIAKWIGGSYVDTCGNTTGLVEHEPQNVLFFPNPVTHGATFQFSNSQDRTILIYDQLGKEVWRQQLYGEQQIQLSCAQLTDGMYFYTVIDKQGTGTTGKFIIQH